MFCLIYFPESGVEIQPNVLEISQNQSTLVGKMEELGIQRCIDEVGRKNFVNTLEQKDLLSIQYPIYPTLALKKLSNTVMAISRLEKKQVVDKGYLYNSTKEVVEMSSVGTYYVVPVEHWKYEDLPQRPEEEKQKVVKPVQIRSETMLKNYDRVLLQLIESIQKRKID